jgi:hypothetical protein
MSSLSVADEAQSSTKCGALCKRKRIRDGSGMPLIITVGRCEQTFSVAVRIASFSSSKPVGTRWHHAVLHRWVGRLRAATRRREAPGWQGQYAANREPTHQSPAPDQTVSASYHVLFQDGTHARSGDWAVHQPVRMWTVLLSEINTCETPSANWRRSGSPSQSNRPAPWRKRHCHFHKS